MSTAGSGDQEVKKCEKVSKEIPRRCRVDRWCEAELAISRAVDEVEKMPADLRLTDAVLLLGDARGKVADFVDQIPKVEMDNYVAWCRYTGTTIVTCDSDAQGAFRVYRRER